LVIVSMRCLRDLPSLSNLFNDNYSDRLTTITLAG
jgi:hypothetical protein